MELIDCHCHLNSKLFQYDRPQVIQRAVQAGITAMLDSGETFEENEKSLRLTEKQTFLKTCAGFSPKCLKLADSKLAQDHIRANAGKIIAIGEVGLDYWCVKEPEERKRQREIFESFIELAKELGKPVVVHSRSAGSYAIDMLVKHNATRVCMHAFDGSAESAKDGVEHGFFFSIPPSVKFSQQKKNLVEALPLENLLLESDAPALGPEHGKRNEPKNILVSLEEIAKIKNVSTAEVARITTENAKKLFGL